jgi:hypothetical protein
MPKKFVMLTTHHHHKILGKSDESDEMRESEEDE